jgi:hypothetical protein
MCRLPAVKCGYSKGRLSLKAMGTRLGSSLIGLESPVSIVYSIKFVRPKSDSCLEKAWLYFAKRLAGKIRPCVDYRRLNAVTVKDDFPLPRIQDCLDTVRGSTLFSTFDLTSGYHQIPVKREDVPKTALHFSGLNFKPALDILSKTVSSRFI